MTSEIDTRCLEIFPQWLRSLGEDAEQLVTLMLNDHAPEGVRRALAGGLNYLFKSLDLIPDGIDDIGYLDDAFVLRLAASMCLGEDVQKLSAEALGAVSRLANDVDTIEKFLGESEFKRLDRYVQGLKKGAARGRSVDDIVQTPAVREEFAADVRGFAKNYNAPSFAREPKNLIKLRAFFDAKLPR